MLGLMWGGSGRTQEAEAPAAEAPQAPKAEGTPPPPPYEAVVMSQEVRAPAPPTVVVGAC